MITEFSQESKMHRDVTREIKIKSKSGMVFEGQKSELQKAFEKRSQPRISNKQAKELTELERIMEGNFFLYFMNFQLRLKNH